MTRSLSLYWW